MKTNKKTSGLEDPALEDPVAHDSSPLKNLLKPNWASVFSVDSYGLFADFSIEGIVQRMRWIEPGSFLMGSPNNEPERFNDEQQHHVTLTQGFWMANTTCTQDLWKAVMKNNPSRFKNGQKPVEQVSYEDIQMFFEKAKRLIPEMSLSLPNEAQWEYACRAGTETAFSFGETVSTDQVNFDVSASYGHSSYDAKKDFYQGKDLPVKSLPCNPWGLYEMHGNVLERCDGWYGEYPEHPVVDPSGAAFGETRPVRGGSWILTRRSARSACRGNLAPDFSCFSMGFRFLQVSC